MTLADYFTTSAVVVTSRRRAPRVDATNQLAVDIVNVLVPAHVLDIGPGGFSVETRCALRVGALHDFRFVTHGRTIELKARVIHCRPSAQACRGEERYVAGFEFVADASGTTTRRVGQLMDAVTSVLTFN